MVKTLVRRIGGEEVPKVTIKEGIVTESSFRAGRDSKLTCLGLDDGSCLFISDFPVIIPKDTKVRLYYTESFYSGLRPVALDLEEINYNAVFDERYNLIQF